MGMSRMTGHPDNWPPAGLVTKAEVPVLEMRLGNRRRMLADFSVLMWLTSSAFVRVADGPGFIGNAAWVEVRMLVKTSHSS